MFRKYCCIKQKELKDCGYACLATICKQYGSKISIYRIREIAKIDKRWVLLWELWKLLKF